MLAFAQQQNEYQEEIPILCSKFFSCRGSLEKMSVSTSVHKTRINGGDSLRIVPQQMHYHFIYCWIGLLIFGVEILIPFSHLWLVTLFLSSNILVRLWCQVLLASWNQLGVFSFTVLLKNLHNTDIILCSYIWWNSPVMPSEFGVF